MRRKGETCHEKYKKFTRGNNMYALLVKWLSVQQPFQLQVKAKKRLADLGGGRCEGVDARMIAAENEHCRRAD
jgi:hypothetical protein